MREQGRALAALGRFDEALQQFDGARSRFTALAATSELVGVWTAETECLLLAGRDEEAASSLRRAEELQAEVSKGAADQGITRIRGFLALATGRTQDAADAFSEVVSWTGSTDDPREVGFAHLGLALLADGGKDEHAHLDASRAVLEPLGVDVTAEHARPSLTRRGVSDRAASGSAAAHP